MISLMNFLHANLFYITLAIFVAGNIIVEWLRRRTENFLQQPLSDFLTGRYGWIQSLAYLIFGLGLAWLGYITHISLYYVAAVAIGFVVATKWDYYYHPRQGWIEHAHIISAGIAFGAATAGLIVERPGILPWLAPISYSAVMLTWKTVSACIHRTTGVTPDNQTVGEKVYTAGLLLSFIL